MEKRELEPKQMTNGEVQDGSPAHAGMVRSRGYSRGCHRREFAPDAVI